MTKLIEFAVLIVVAAGAGAYLGVRFDTKIRADIAYIKGIVEKIKL